MWILHPRGGLKPIAQSIAIGPNFTAWTPESMHTQDMLRTLSREGVQMVQVRILHKRNVPVMYLTGNDPVKFIHDVVDHLDPPTLALKWNNRHLVQIETHSKLTLFPLSEFAMYDLSTCIVRYHKMFQVLWLMYGGVRCASTA